MANMMDIDQQALAQPDQVEEAPAQPDAVDQVPPGQPDLMSDDDEIYAHVDSDTLSLPGLDGQEGETEVASGAWEYTLWHEGLIS